ncbi:hypothetical protein [Rhizobium sp. LEGMi135b]
MSIRISGAGSAPRTVTVTATIRQRASRPTPQPTVIHEPEILPPTRNTNPLSNANPLSSETVKRIVERAVQNWKVPDLSIRPKLAGWIKLPDGTTLGIVEHRDTGVRYQIMVCPGTFQLKNLGPIDI